MAISNLEDCRLLHKIVRRSLARKHELPTIDCMTAITVTSAQRSHQLKLLPKHERYLDAFQRFIFLAPEHLQCLFGRNLKERTLRWDLARLMSAGYLSRLRKNKDEEYTYYPAMIREKSTLTLDHTSEITWAQVLIAVYAATAGYQVMACERRARRVKFAVYMANDEGVVKQRWCLPDFFCALRNPAKPPGSDTEHFFWEVTNAKPGQHWKKENDVVQKCEAYNAYFDSSEFVDRLQKEYQLEVRNFRVVITFPTEARARNFISIFRSRGIAYPGRFWVSWKDAYHANMYGPIFLSPKDDSLHSLCD